MRMCSRSKNPRIRCGFGEIYDPPPLRWVRGPAELMARPAIAIVGTRHPSPYGSGAAEMLARDLAARQLPVVRGLAGSASQCWWLREENSGMRISAR